MGKIAKRVLMLCHPEMDHLAYAMYDGLYKVLGKDNLAIYPFVKHYQGDIDNWYTLDDGKKGFTSAPGYVSRHETTERSFDDLVNNIRSFDIIYLSSARTYAIRSLDQFIARSGRNNLPPIVFSEGEDYQNLNTIRMIKQRYNPVACFKREYIQSEIDSKGGDLHPIYPLPFAAISDGIPPDNPNKDIDVFALFGNTWPIRENIVRLINSRLSEKGKYIVGIDHWSESGSVGISHYPYRAYLEHMARAKINIVARGWGCDTLRRFEAPMYSGLVMSDNIPITTPYPFVDNVNIIYYNNDLSGLIEKIEYYLNNSGERERIGKAGREHCIMAHTTEARAKYFLSRIEGHI